MAPIVSSDASLTEVCADFIAIPIIFYIIVAAARLDLGKLREAGWLFDMETADDPWWKFYTFYGARLVFF